MSYVRDPEIESLIPPLGASELDQLKKNVIGQGIQSPFITAVIDGKDVLLDGYNRDAICSKYGVENHRPPITLGVMKREQAIEWVIKNQLGRRNLSAIDRVKLALRLKPAIEEQAKENQREAGGDKSEAPLTTLSEAREPVNTRKEIAKVANTSEGTVANVEKVLESGDTELITAVESGKISVSKAAKTLSPPPTFNAARAWERLTRQIDEFFDKLSAEEVVEYSDLLRGLK